MTNICPTRDRATLAYEPTQLVNCLEKFAKKRILIVGDAMLDEYLIGEAERISPEAPVPVVRIDEAKHMLGGAGNVARNITALGGKAVLVGVCGNDAPGRTMQRCCHQEGIAHALLTLEKRPTTTKTRILARQQQVVRFDREATEALTADESASLLQLAAKHLATCDALILSDYGKGLISRRVISALYSLLRKSRRTIPVLVDPKPQNIQLYKGVTLLTPNAKETSEATRLPVKSPQDIILAGQSLIRRLKCRHLVTTLGSRGMAVFEDDESVWHIPTAAKQVFDVTGAGDTVIATVALGLATGLQLVPACLLANHAAGLVVGQVGASTISSGQLAGAIMSQAQTEIARWR
jgi:rfaE bifunctional protein kinase chain/domain